MFSFTQKSNETFSYEFQVIYMLVALQKMLVNYGLRAEYGQFYDMPKSNHFLSQLHQGESPLPGGQIHMSFFICILFNLSD